MLNFRGQTAKLIPRPPHRCFTKGILSLLPLMSLQGSKSFHPKFRDLGKTFFFCANTKHNHGPLSEPPSGGFENKLFFFLFTLPRVFSYPEWSPCRKFIFCTNVGTRFFLREHCTWPLSDPPSGPSPQSREGTGVPEGERTSWCALRFPRHHMNTEH